MNTGDKALQSYGNGLDWDRLHVLMNTAYLNIIKYN
jgi:hypothetical protein